MPRSTGAPIHFDRVALIGLGLIGSSLGWVLKKQSLATEIVGHDVKPAVRALRYIDLCNAGVFVPGAPLQAVQKRIRQYLERPDFLPSYMAGVTEPAEQKRRLVELKGKLAAIGLHEAETDS